MMVFAEALLLTALLGIVSLLAGRLFVAAFDVTLLKRASPEALVAAAFVGTGWLLLAFGWGSHAGLTAPYCLIVVLISLTYLSVRAARHQRLSGLVRLPSGRLCLGGVVLGLGVRVAICLLSLYLGRIYYVFNDTMTYTACADWLQSQGFGTPTTVDRHPIDQIVSELQGISHRMGPIFLLALLKAALPGRLSLELLPPVMAWGAVLNLGGIFLLCRWGLRLSRFASVCGLFLSAMAFNSLCASTDQGFLCQVYGTGTLAFALALLTRLLSRSRWQLGNAILLGLVLAMQLSVYSELSPVLALAGMVAALWLVARRRQKGLCRFAGATLLALLVLGNIEILRAAQGVLHMTQNNSVGRHIAWGVGEYARFALGYYPVMIFGSPGDEPWPHQVSSLTAASALALGVGWLLWRRRSVPLLAAVSVFAGLIGYFGWVAVDPWTKSIGHTWNLFKLCKWVFPVVSALQVAGVVRLLQVLPCARPLLLMTCAAVAWISAPLHKVEARRIVDSMSTTVGRHMSLRHLRELHQQIELRNPPSLYMLGTSEGPWPRCFAAYFLYPRPFTNGWRGSYFFCAPCWAEDRPEAMTAETLFLLNGPPPFAEPKERLPFGYTVVDGLRPIVFRCDNINGVQPSPVNHAWIGNEPATLWVYCPCAGMHDLSLRVSAGPCLPSTGLRTLQVTTGEGCAQTQTMDTSSGANVRFSVRLPRGISTLTVCCLDAPTLKLPEDPRTLLVGVEQVRLCYSRRSER